MSGKRTVGAGKAPVRVAAFLIVPYAIVIAGFYEPDWADTLVGCGRYRLIIGDATALVSFASGWLAIWPLLGTRTSKVLLTVAYVPLCYVVVALLSITAGCMITGRCF